jgi:hypothetical protein
MKYVKTFESFKKKSLLENNSNPEVDEPEIEIMPEVEPETIPDIPEAEPYPGYDPDEEEGDDEGIERPEVDTPPLAEKPNSEEETIRQIVARINNEG